MVQLHGDESERFCERVANYVTVIKAFRLSDNDPIDWMVRPYHEGCDMYMFDTLGAGYGGTGKKFDWNILKGTTVNKLFFLSGGIEPGDEDRLKQFAMEPQAQKLFAVDINSKFEVSAGVKNMEKIASRVENVLPEVIFLDIDMPLMDGFQFLDEFEKLSNVAKRKCKIVMLTSSINPQDFNRSKKYEAVRLYLNKPLSHDSILKLDL